MLAIQARAEILRSWAAPRVSQTPSTPAKDRPAGLLGDEIELFKQGARRRLYCVHCGHFQDIGSEGECTCGQCRVKLFVREHFSQRLGAYMGVCIDPDSPYAAEVPA